MANYEKALKKGTRIAGAAYTYEIDSVLGQGGFGITYLAMARPKAGGTSMKVALKEFFMNTGSNSNDRSGTTVSAGSTSSEQFERYRRKFINEADKLKRLRHSRIIKVYEQFDANATSYYSMEYMPAGNFNQFINGNGLFSEEKAIHFALQIADGLAHMHANHMLHLDLKPGNIMMKDSDNLVIIDFGLSKIVSDDGVAESSSIISGLTRYYAPPEQANFKFVEGAFPATLDVYPLGAILFRMLSNEMPPDDIINDGFPRSQLHASKEMIDLVEQAMEPRYKKRIQSVDEFRHRLEALPSAKPKPAPQPKQKPAPAPKPTAQPKPKPAPKPQPSPAPAPKPAPVKYVSYCVNCGHKFESDDQRFCIMCGNERLRYK